MSGGGYLSKFIKLYVRIENHEDILSGMNFLMRKKFELDSIFYFSQICEKKKKLYIRISCRKRILLKGKSVFPFEMIFH